MIWQANVDLQFIRESSSVLDRYITSYITKAEKNSTAAIWEECNNNKTLQGAIKSVALKSFKDREVGLYEVGDKLLGYHLYEFSDIITWLPAYPTKERRRRLKDHKDIKNLADNDNRIFHTCLLDDYYPNRPEELNDLCLHTVQAMYDYKTKICHVNCPKLNNNLGYLHKRAKAKVIKVPYIKPVDSESTERYCFQMLQLFKPWRCESELKGEFESYREALKYASDNNSLKSDEYNNFEIKRIKIQ